MKRLLFLFALIVLTGCSKDDVYQLTITNNVESLENFEIRSVSVEGLDFNNLAIGIGKSKTFTLNEIQGGADNTNITIGYWCGTRSWNVAQVFDIKKNTTITISQTPSGGCRDIELN